MTEALAAAEALSKLQDVESLVSKLAEAEQHLEGGYARLGLLLEDVKQKRYWIGSYPTFGAFVEHLSEKYNKGRAQLHNYRSTVSKLLEAGISPEEMNQMGINKARVLAHTDNPPAFAIEAALKPEVTAQQVEDMLDEITHRPPPENTKWYNLNLKFYLTDEEWQTIDDGFNAARHSDPVIPADAAESVQLKLIVLKLVQDFLSTNSEHVVVGGRGL